MTAENDNGGDDGSSDELSDQDITEQDPDFDLSSLPDDLPAELVPPDFDTGQYSEITGFPTATFESTMPFDDLVAHHDGAWGESIVVGDPGETVATWTRNPPWAVSVFDGEVRLIAIAKLPES